MPPIAGVPEPLACLYRKTSEDPPEDREISTVAAVVVIVIVIVIVIVSVIEVVGVDVDVVRYCQLSPMDP